MTCTSASAIRVRDSLGDGQPRLVDGAQYARQLADIEATARNKMQEATAHGKQIAEQIADQARKDADAALERNKQVIAIEMEKAREELRQEVVEMTMTMPMGNMQGGDMDMSAPMEHGGAMATPTP